GSAVASRARDDEPVSLVQQLAAADLGCELRACEDALVHRPARAVLQHALLPAHRLGTRLARRRDDDELGRDTPRLGEKAEPFGLLQVAVEVAREDAVEAVVLKRQLESVALDEACARSLFGRNREHPLALVDPDHLSAQMPCQETGATGDVERSDGRKMSDHLRENSELLFPPRPVAVRVQPFAEPP